MEKNRINSWVYTIKKNSNWGFFGQKMTKNVKEKNIDYN
jgi:hypothetical protein